MKKEQTIPVPADWGKFAARFESSGPAPTFKILGPNGHPIGIMAFAVEVDDDFTCAINAAFETLQQHPAYLKLAVSR